MFGACGPQVHEKYPDIEYSETIVDNACMQLVKNPAQFDVLVRRPYLPERCNDIGDVSTDVFWL